MQHRLFEEGTVPDFATREWYSERERAPHLEQDAHRERILVAARLVVEAVELYGVRTISDMGAGDGGLLSLLPPMLADLPPCDYWGYDLIPANVEGAKQRGVNVELADFLTDPVRWGELAVCTEVIEHLLDPHRFVHEIPSRVVVASSPAYETVEHHYENHAWVFDVDGYRQLFEQGGFRVVRHEQIAFQVVMAVRS